MTEPFDSQQYASPPAWMTMPLSIPNTNPFSPIAPGIMCGRGETPSSHSRSSSSCISRFTSNFCFLLFSLFLAPFFFRVNRCPSVVNNFSFLECTAHSTKKRDYPDDKILGGARHSVRAVDGHCAASVSPSPGGEGRGEGEPYVFIDPENSCLKAVLPGQKNQFHVPLSNLLFLFVPSVQIPHPAPAYSSAIPPENGVPNRAICSRSTNYQLPTTNY